MRRGDAIWVGVLVAAFAALVGPMLALGVGGGNERWDEETYHLPVIAEFAGALPTPDLVSYRVAMTPGWHLLMAILHDASGGSERLLRSVNALFGLAVVLLLYAACRRSVGPATSAALATPALVSNYLLGASASLTTDNAAWALALGSIYLLVLRPATTPSVAVGSVLAVGAVLVRQVFVWLAAPIALVAISATPLVRLLPRAIRAPIRRRRPLVAVIGAAGTLAVFGVVLGFVVAWDGLVPNHPEMRRHFERGSNGAAFPFALTLAGALALPLAPAWWAELRRLRPGDAAAWIAVALGLGAGLLFETSWRRIHRSMGWVWRAVQEIELRTGGTIREVDGRLQVVGSWSDPLPARSLAIALGSTVGALLVLLLYRAARRAGRGREALVLLLTMLGFVLAQSFNIVAAQRYSEPIVLSGVVVLAAMTVAPRSAGERPGPASRRSRSLAAGALALAAAQLLLSAITTFREAYGAEAAAPSPHAQPTAPAVDTGARPTE